MNNLLIHKLLESPVNLTLPKPLQKKILKRIKTLHDNIIQRENMIKSK